MAKKTMSKASTIKISDDKEDGVILKKTLKISAKNENQINLIKSIKNNIITFTSGPAGTGKTLIAVVFALKGLIDGHYEKIIFSRPCVEAEGENLGFLPGNYNDKIFPYMMPIFSFLNDYLEKKSIDLLIREGKIATLPLAFQRGLSFNNAFVVLDESQNTSISQMRMFLTRAGENCKIVVTGDPRQSDIRGRNGLTHAIKLFDDKPDVGVIEFSEDDIVRSDIVRMIEREYSRV